VTKKAANLETVDLTGVEILRTGGPVHGRGSPPEGDNFDPDQLRAMAEAHAELQAELHPPAAVNPPMNELGHGNFEAPAVGYLENVRVDKTGTRLLADVKKVPKTLSRLIKAGAYRKRSVTLASITSQETGKKYPWVVTRLAWLGARLPAIRTMDDVVALYDGGDVEVVRVVEYADGRVVWEPSESAEAVRSDLREALNGPPPYGPSGAEFWVRDVAISGDAALVANGYGDDQEAWVVPFSRGEDGTVTVAPRSEWIKAEQTWIATAKQFADAASGNFERPADTRSKMADLNLNDEAQRELASALGVEGEISAETLLAAAKAKPEPPAASAEPDKELAEVRAMAEETKTKLDATTKLLANSGRDTFIERALSEGRFEPGQRGEIEKFYDADPEACRKYVASIEKNDKLAREYGSDDAEAEKTDEERQLEDDREKQAIATEFGIPLEQVI
jgi:hypothetical protein